MKEKHCLARACSGLAGKRLVMAKRRWPPAADAVDERTSPLNQSGSFLTFIGTRRRRGLTTAGSSMLAMILTAPPHLRDERSVMAGCCLTRCNNRPRFSDLTNGSNEYSPACRSTLITVRFREIRILVNTNSGLKSMTRKYSPTGASDNSTQQIPRLFVYPPVYP